MFSNLSIWLKFSIFILHYALSQEHIDIIFGLGYLFRATMYSLLSKHYD